jgi:hypothetical protein
MSNEKELEILYKQLKGFLKQLGRNNVVESVVNDYHRMVDKLASITGEDYSYLKVSQNDSFIGGMTNASNSRYYKSEPLRTKIGLTIGTLEGLLDVDENDNIRPGQIIQILNQNDNTLAVKIETSINQLAENETDEETKTKLKELDEELKSKNKNKIGQIMKWFIEKGLMSLLVQILPEIVKRI